MSVVAALDLHPTNFDMVLIIFSRYYIIYNTKFNRRIEIDCIYIRSTFRLCFISRKMKLSEKTVFQNPDAKFNSVYGLAVIGV